MWDCVILFFKAISFTSYNIHWYFLLEFIIQWWFPNSGFSDFIIPSTFIGLHFTVRKTLLFSPVFIHLFKSVWNSEFLFYSVGYLLKSLHSAFHICGFCTHRFTQGQTENIQEKNSRKFQKTKLEFFWAPATTYIAFA